METPYDPLASHENASSRIALRDLEHLIVVEFVRWRKKSGNLPIRWPRGAAVFASIEAQSFAKDRGPPAKNRRDNILGRNTAFFWLLPLSSESPPSFSVRREAVRLLGRLGREDKCVVAACGWNG